MRRKDLCGDGRPPAMQVRGGYDAYVAAWTVLVLAVGSATASAPPATASSLCTPPPEPLSPEERVLAKEAALAKGARRARARGKFKANVARKGRAPVGGLRARRPRGSKYHHEIAVALRDRHPRVEVNLKFAVATSAASSP